VIAVKNRYGQHFQTRQTPQVEPIPGKPMVANSAGGYTFAIDDWSRLERFLVLGSEGGTYYATERKLTIENAQGVLRCLTADARRAVEVIASISESGRAPKNAPSVFALAIAAGMGHLAAVAEADALRRVCRIPTDLFAFVEAVDGLRGWGRGLRKLVASWYAGKSADQLAYQVTKYRQRDGWTHRDVLRLAHPVAGSDAHQAVYRWAVAGSDGLGERSVSRKVGPAGSYAAVAELPAIVESFREAQAATDKATVVRLIREAGLVREHIPTRWLNEPEVWEALLDKMPLTAMVRNLGKMTSIGLLAPLSAASRVVADRLADGAYIRKSRVHPIAVLMAAKVYSQGRGEKGKLSWSPVPTINDALDSAFYEAFANVVPAGKRTMLCLDISGSMGSPILGTSLMCSEGSCAMALVTARVEPEYHVMAFNSTLTPIGVTKSDRLTDALRKTANWTGGSTDCAVPMTYALANKLEVDTFQVYTDSETYYGNIHPSQALVKYRNEMGIPAKLAVVGMTSTGFSIADPTDSGMLDFVGFDAAAPGLLADFSRGSAARGEAEADPSAE
jgi:60 kDa SS-A/Ro ribonucleoprotein